MKVRRASPRRALEIWVGPPLLMSRAVALNESVYTVFLRVYGVHGANLAQVYGASAAEATRRAAIVKLALEKKETL
jgi:hypothetical protein